jgi:hypothetical protein
MRRCNRLMLLAALLAIAPILSACESFDMDKFDIFNLNEKKKLPGDRKSVFPEGVPGVSQGVPPEMVKGHQPPPETANALPPEPAKPEAAKPKPKRVARPPQPAAQPSAQNQGAGPAQQRQPPQSAQPSWPAPGQQQPAQTAWPPPPSGTFSR